MSLPQLTVNRLCALILLKWRVMKILTEEEEEEARAPRGGESFEVFFTHQREFHLQKGKKSIINGALF